MPSHLRISTAALSALVLAASVATIVAGFLVPQHPAWALIAFELLTALAGGFGLALAAGRFAEGPGMALACISGTILASSILGYLGATGQIGDWKLQGWLIAHILISLLLALIAISSVLGRTPGAWLVALRGFAYAGVAVGFTSLLVAFDGHLKPSGSGSHLVGHALASALAVFPLPLLLLFGAFTVTSTTTDESVPRWMRLLGQLSIPVTAGVLILLTRAHLSSPLSGAADVVRITLLCLLALELTGALCAGVHLIVQAFASCDKVPGIESAGPTLTPKQGATSS
ncbi:MAG: hypothetical protein U0573_06845 [Phycisphaerales bacterium]|nr:hypothetical protein [Planctomycetota bacterium]